MSFKVRNELAILFVAICIGYAVAVGALWSAAFIFSYGVLRLLWLIVLETNEEAEL